MHTLDGWVGGWVDGSYGSIHSILGLTMKNMHLYTLAHVLRSYQAIDMILL